MKSQAHMFIIKMMEWCKNAYRRLCIIQQRKICIPPCSNILTPKTMKGISFHFNPVMILKTLAFSCSMCCICTLLLWLFFFQLSSYVHDVSSLNNFTVTLYGRNFYYYPVNKTIEVKSTVISNAAAFCSEIRKQIKRQRLQSLSTQNLKQNTTKVFAIV